MRPVMIVGAMLTVAGIIAMADVWVDIVQIALGDEEASHVLLVPIVVMWLICVRRDRVSKLRIRGQFAGPLIVVVGWLLSWWGYHHAIQSFWHGGGVLVMIGCIVSALGVDVLRRFGPAFAALCFLVPVPALARQQIAIPLQTATAVTAQVIFDGLGVYVQRSGNVLSLNGSDVAIAEACNGMRMVFALILVSYTFAFGMSWQWHGRVMILLCSPIAAIVCNVIRLMPTVWIHGYHGEHAARSFHDVSGWLMLPVAFVLLLSVLYVARWIAVYVGAWRQQVWIGVNAS